jgi:HEAT repeat protein
MTLLIKVVAELRESVRAAIPYIITLLGDDNSYVRTAGATVLSKFLAQGNILNFPV